MTDRVIRIDDDVEAELLHRAAPGETPNTIVRRLLDMPPKDGARRSRWTARHVDEGLRPTTECPNCGATDPPEVLVRGRITYHRCRECDFSTWTRSDYEVNR